MAPTTEWVPTLTPKIIGDDAAVAARIEQLVERDPGYRHHVRATRHAQHALRGVLADREWASYQDVAAAVSARCSYTLSRVVKWAFEQGQRHPTAPAGS